MRALVWWVWLLTAGLGSYLATVWIRHGGLSQRLPGVTRLPLWLVGGHVLLAAGGLVAWSAYLMGGVRGSAWAACAVALIVAAFGFMMLLRWLPSSGRHSQAGTAERHFPLAAVVAHGMCAGATVLLVVIVVLRRM
ncbi:hypothetical protein [Streptomyces sp. NBC_01431]|uniref:hypothetical protein n=1 Tax=Streptomyces sp. NBC_01431 TaxID=2903863 RepID=UPI002E317A8A|nr:hypothetical protein [Streptomyces sp. NBC_01431]